MNPAIRLVLTIIVFVGGASMVLSGLNNATKQAASSQPLTQLWWLVPGIILLIVSYPLLHYYYDKWKHGYKGSRQHDALEQAAQELEKKGQDDAKK